MALWAQDAFVTSLSKLGASDVRQSQLREMGPAAQVFANRHDGSALHREKKNKPWLGRSAAINIDAT